MRYLTLCLILFIFISTKAQKGAYVEVGANASRFAAFNEEKVDNLWSPQVHFIIYRPIVKGTLNYHIGIGYQRIGEKMDVLTDVMTYSGTNTNYNDWGFNAEEPAYELLYQMNASYKTTIHTLKIPFQLEYTYWGFQVFAGFYLSKNYGGEFESSFSLQESNKSDITQQQANFNESFSQSENYEQEYKSDLNVEDWHNGYSFAIGYKIKQWSLRLRYEQGLKAIGNINKIKDPTHNEIFESYSRNPDIDYGSRDNNSRLEQRTISFNIAFYLNQN